MSIVTWNDVYRELWIQAAQSRGTVTSFGDLPATTRYSTLPEWPRTTGADAIAIASVVDPILSASPLRPGGYGITRLWQTAVLEIESVAFPLPSVEYAHNRALWSTLLAVAAHLSTLGAPVPDQDAWATLVAALWSPVVEYRNAVGPTKRPLTAPTFATMWALLWAELGTARGFDVQVALPDQSDAPIDVPRTTNADVLQLVVYWSRALVELQIAVMTGRVTSPADFEAVQLGWQVVTANVNEYITPGNAHEVYPHNHELWRAMRTLSFALDVLDEAPAPYEVVDSVKPVSPTATATAHKPPTPSQPKHTDLSHRLSDTADAAVTALAHIMQDASNRLVSTVGRPLLAGGAVLAAMLLLMRATARCDCDGEPASEGEPAPDAEAR